MHFYAACIFIREQKLCLLHRTGYIRTINISANLERKIHIHEHDVFVLVSPLHCSSH